jgi:hypothetical protein
MNYSAALIEWESGGLDDVETKNLHEFISDLIVEVKKRGYENTPPVDERLLLIDRDGEMLEGFF